MRTTSFSFSGSVSAFDWVDVLDQWGKITPEAKKNYLTRRDNLGKTFLIFVAESDNISLCNELILMGADLNIQDKAGRTALSRVSEKEGDRFDICALLLGHGAKTDILDNFQWNALIRATRAGNLRICQELIKYKASINDADKDGATALYFGAENGFLQICKLLIQNGADVNIETSLKKTALIIAVEKAHLEICKELMRSGAKFTIEELLRIKLENHIKEFLEDKTQIQALIDEGVPKRNKEQGLGGQEKISENIIAIQRAEESQKRLELANYSSETNNETNNSSNNNHLNESLLLQRILASVNEIDESAFSKHKPLQTHQMLQENNQQVAKDHTKIKNDFDESRLGLENQKIEFELKKKNLAKNYDSQDELFKELNKLIEEATPLEEEIEKSKNNLAQLNIEFQKTKSIFDECEKIINIQFKEIVEKNKKFMEKWDHAISKGNIDQNENENCYDKELLYGLLEFCNLDDWDNELDEQLLSTKSKKKISDIRPHHLITLKKNNNSKKMSFGEAKYFCIVIEEIQKNKELPKIMNDIDLSEENIKFWTIKNVYNYFKNTKNMNEVAKILDESKINGIVLLSLNESEIQNFGIKSIEELDSFIDLLKQLQKNNNDQNNEHNKQKVEVENQKDQKKQAAIPPEDLICPLSNKLMIDPVIAQDGNTYERKAIEEWFKSGNNTSPITGEQIETFLIPNKLVKNQCEKWRKENEK